VVTPRKAAHDVVTWLTPDRRPQPAARLMRHGSGLAPGLLLGTVLDALLADPRRGHPVAAFGAAASRAEGRLWAASHARGAVFTLACIAPVAAAGWGLQRLAGRGPAPLTARRSPR
jgi:adenosylcobinamide-phosphate synthase